ncbi:hypothetical protein AB0E67_34240 [Streptomyces sp. NPDC032161]|uniref:hypothetical protein n=1 Tax=unclassified Streptomyces TaxID=2593676 RepID=UPI003407DCF0
MGIAALPGPPLTRAPPDAGWPDAHAAGRHRPARPGHGRTAAAGAPSGRGIPASGRARRTPSGAGTSKLLIGVINGKTADQLLREGRPVHIVINALRDTHG